MQKRPGNTNLTSDRASRTRPDLGSRRLRATAFGVSFVVHVLAVLMYPAVVRTLRPSAVSLSPPATSGPIQGSVVLRLIEIDETVDPERPEDPEEIEEIEADEADAETPLIEGLPTVILVPPGPTVAELLRPHRSDARLWAEPPPEFYALSMEQREELILADRIVEWYDSVAIARAATDRLTDWTFRDSDGGRWGIADGKIYLGDMAVPLPLNFGTPVGKRDETNRRMWEFDEIERQSQRFLIEQTWKQRSAAIRARRDRERAEAAPDSTRSR